MDSRERVLTAIHHAEPDRVPVALGGGAHSPTDPVYTDLLKALQLGDPVPPFRRNLGHSVNYYDDRVLAGLEIDVRHCWGGFPDLGGPPSAGGHDSWGIGWKRSGLYLSAVQHPLQPASLEDIARHPWPDPERLMRRDELRERAAFLRERTPYAVVGRAFDSYGPFERCCLLRRTDQFMLDLAGSPDQAEALIEQVTRVMLRALEIYLDAAGHNLDVIELPGDDYAAQRPIISPKMFDRYFAPTWRRLIQMIRQAAPQCAILFHSDGNMQPFLGRLIDLGVDVFHCLEPLPGVDFIQIKAEYGDRLCFWGAIDTKQALQGDPATVEAEVRARIAALAPGGGYVLAPTNHLQPDVPAANVVALFRAARAYGRYPIRLDP